MTDKELLEMAAKAAEIKALRDPYGFLRDCTGMDPAMNIFAGKEWNPLTDDGDALRLAVKLDMKVYIGEAYPYQKECADYPVNTGCAVDEYEEPDPYAATRRAIVRAAAEIGKTK